MGFELSLDELLQEWENHNKQYEEFLKEITLEEIYDYFKP